MFTLCEISKSYEVGSERINVLKNASLRITAGEFVALQGPSGCGKSTLLLICGTMLAPDSGEVLIEGTDVNKLSAEKRAEFRAVNIGFVFQRFHLVPYLNVYENILSATLNLDIENASSKAEKLAKRFGLTSRINHKPSELSVGERQRVALARALLHSPKLLLADEPTGNLDPKSAEIVVDAIKEFTDNGGAALMVTHDPTSAAKAHRVENNLFKYESK
jgi:ABC-type lipoprotein export system ATPase subunit